MATEQSVSILNSLITTTIDSADGFERAAEDASAARFAEMFREFAHERRGCVALLQDTVRSLGGEPNDDGSFTAGVHRRWLDLRDALSGGGDRAIIEEVERGEDHIKSKYEEALADASLDTRTRTAVEEAYQSVRAGHDRASELKHGLSSTQA